MADIRIYHSVYEDGVAVTSDDGDRLEATVTHLPGSEPVFHLAQVDFDEDGNPTVTELFSCPVNAA